jgi:UDP-galactopyranose mutase
VLALVDSKLVPVPINLDTVNKLYNLSLTSDELEGFFGKLAEKREAIRTSEDVVVSRVGRQSVRKDVPGIHAQAMEPGSFGVGRVRDRADPCANQSDDRYLSDTYQAMPLHGYTRMFEAMLDHPNIKILLNTDWREVRNVIPARGSVLRTDR